jgi:F-type H+-transporting ATPase subunit gamma
MASARELQKRIRSVRNISQITRALEAVSASRVRRAQARVLASRAFAEKAWEILLNIQAAGKGGPSMHPLLTERETINNIMIVLITSDRGLAGAFNTNIIRVAHRFADRLNKPTQFVTVGRKGRDSMIRAGRNVVAEFSDMPAEPSIANISPVAHLAMDAFLSGEVDDVFIAYTDFINTLTQRPVVLGWLPLIPHTIEDQVAAEFVKDVPAVSESVAAYDYEPGPEAILQEIVPRFTELQLYQALLESQASEHSARMVAMRNASDNAAQLVDDLTLDYNKARQAGITAEILDIVGGTEALQSSIDKSADDLLVAYESMNAAVSHTVKRGDRGNGSGDDLTRIEGIGKKMAAALQSAGISTFEALAAADEEALRSAIEAAGMRFSPSLPTWAAQAAYAAHDDWDGLQTYQESLVAGREN